MEVLKPVSVIGAAILMQISLLAIIFFGTVLRTSSKYGMKKISSGAIYATGLMLAIFTIPILVLSENLYAMWAGIMGDLQLPTITHSVAMMLVFIFNIATTILLVSLTGGTSRSQYTSILFLIPTLAIFLRETPIKFLTYTLVVAGYYLLSYSARRAISLSVAEEFKGDSAAHAAVNIGCLVLATITGYITRPISI